MRYSKQIAPNTMFYMFKSWLGWLNFFILQWFFVRLQKTVVLNEDGSLGHNLGYGFIYWIVPLTGWWTDYTWIGRKHE